MTGGWPFADEPKAVQLEALRRSQDRDCYGWWMEPGLAKTAVCYADFIRECMADRCEVLVVISPYYLMSEWQLEADKRGVNFPVLNWPTALPHNLKPPFAFVINIEASRDGRGLKFVTELMKRYKCMLAVDESTIIKNFKKISFKTTYELAQLAASRRELSGLPMPHNVMDLWPQLRFLKQLSGVNPYAFRNRFAVMGGYMGKVVKGVKNEDELHKILDACSFRALKSDWAKSLPPKLYVERHFEMTGKQLAAYKEMQSDFVTFVKAGDPESAVFADQVMHAMLKLQQIGRGFIMDNERVAQELVPVKDNPAINTTKAIIEATQGKVLIFTAYRHSAQLLNEALQGYGCRMLIGGMTPGAIKQAKLDFNDDPDIKCFVLQTAIGHRGHTLLGQPGPTTRCSDTLWYESTYNYEHRAQGEERNHRWGQDADCVTQTDLIGSKMDARILAALRGRRDLVRAVLDGGRDPL